MIEFLTAVTALFGGFGLFRAVIGPGRGGPSPNETEWRLLHALLGSSLIGIAALVAAPLGLFGAWAAAFALCIPLALARPDWMVPGRRPDRRRGAMGYGVLVLLMAGLYLVMPDVVASRSPGDPVATDIVAYASLVMGRLWLWRSRADSPWQRLESADDLKALETGAWWDRVWARQQADAAFADADGTASTDADATDDHAFEEAAAKSEAAPDADPEAAEDAALKVPGYDPELLTEELAAFRAHHGRIRGVALAWPSHPVSEALMHVSVILRETRAFLQLHPDKYRDLRPILVGHAETAADIARLVDRIKGVGESLDDPEEVAHRLFALANLMRETRRKSTQAERDRLKASMAVIDDELSALSAVRDLRARMDRDRADAGPSG
jgi:hypothetical protein